MNEKEAEDGASFEQLLTNKLALKLAFKWLSIVYEEKLWVWIQNELAFQQEVMTDGGDQKVKELF